jgi:chemotaxis signal transduction protein
MMGFGSMVTTTRERDADSGAPDGDLGPKQSVLSFVVGRGTRFAVASEHVAEVVDTGPVTPLPRAAGHVEGIAQVGGRPVPVLNLAPLFALPPELPDDAPEEAPRLLVVAAGGMEVALLVRSVIVEEVVFSTPDNDRIAYGDQLRPHVRGQTQTRRGVAVLLDLRGVLEAARVRD